jgi:hypothetical protein
MCHPDIADREKKSNPTFLLNRDRGFCILRLEILLLRRQLAILERKQNQPFRVSRAEKLSLVVLATKLKSTINRTTNQLRDVIRIFQPETVFKWHRELVRRKWTHHSMNLGGRPRTDKELERLVVRLARENSDWGNGRSEGECRKLGYNIIDEMVGNILKRHNILPALERGRSPEWRYLMTHTKTRYWLVTSPSDEYSSRSQFQRLCRTWIRTVREECLDKLLIFNESCLRWVKNEFIDHCDQLRPHQGIAPQSSIPFPTPEMHGEIRCYDRLGAIIHNYYREAA